MKRRSHDQVLTDIRRANALRDSGNITIEAALKRVGLSETTYYNNREEVENGAAAPLSAKNGSAFSKRDEQFSRVAEVKRLRSDGVKTKDAIRRAGFRSPSKYYYYRELAEKQGDQLNGHAPNGSQVESSRALVPMMDKSGRKLVPSNFILSAMLALNATIPQLEALVGCPSGLVQKYLNDGTCPNEFALAVNGLMVSVHTTRTGAGGYVDKRSQEVFMVRLPPGHTGAITNLVSHLGGRVTREEK